MTSIRKAIKDSHAECQLVLVQQHGRPLCERLKSVVYLKL